MERGHLYAWIYGLTVLSSVLAMVWGVWRVSTPELETRFALRGGVVGSVLFVATIGTVEAGFLGYEPVALIPAAVLGMIGFGFGGGIGACAGLLFKRVGHQGVDK